MTLSNLHDRWTGNLFVDGVFRPPGRARTLPVRDKATGETFASVGLACGDDVDGTVRSAAAAQGRWAAESYEVRAGLLRTAAALLRERAETLIDLIMVHINDATCLDEAHVPFGGLGASGLGGRSGGDANLTGFTEQRWVSLQRGAVEYPY